MKQLMAVAIVVCTLSYNWVPVGITLYYHFNKTAITQQLCENKTNPSIHCEGKCFLKKQLKQAEENEQKQSCLLREREELISTNVTSSFFPLSLPVRFIQQHLFASFLYQSNALSSLLKPPLA